MRVQHLFDFPLLVLLQHGALEQPALLPVKAPVSPWSAEQLEIGAALRAWRVRRSSELRAGLNAAVAVDAVNLDSIARFSVEAPVAVIVLG